MARVLPVPAPARMHTGPRTASAASRCSGSRPSSTETAAAVIPRSLQAGLTVAETGPAPRRRRFRPPVTKAPGPEGVDDICEVLSAVVISIGYQAISAGRLPDVVADRLVAVRSDHPLRVAVDGPRAARPFALARSLVEPLRTRGRAAEIIDAESFWRDASLRYEWGRTDLEAYAQRWLDADALRREVLSPLGPGGTSSFLPALRDPATNRSVRATSVTVPLDAIRADRRRAAARPRLAIRLHRPSRAGFRRPTAIDPSGVAVDASGARFLRPRGAASRTR